MREPRRWSVMGLMVCCCLASGGCIDAVREGVTGGITAAVSDVIRTWVTSTVGGALDGDTTADCFTKRRSAPLWLPGGT